MTSVNQVTLSGRVSRPPQRVRVAGEDSPWGYAFPLAVRGDDGLIFPTVLVEGPTLPDCVTYRDGQKLHEQPLITIVGARLRTRNLTLDLASDLARQARRAGADDELIEHLAALLDGCGLLGRHVVTDLLARPEQILPGGHW